VPRSAALDDDDIGADADRREYRTTGQLRRNTERQLALEQSGGRPRERGEGDVCAPASVFGDGNRQRDVGASGRRWDFYACGSNDAGRS
jgi:hypothetical protein